MHIVNNLSAFVIDSVWGLADSDNHYVVERLFVDYVAMREYTKTGEFLRELFIRKNSLSSYQLTDKPEVFHIAAIWAYSPYYSDSTHRFTVRAVTHKCVEFKVLRPDGTVVSYSVVWDKTSATRQLIPFQESAKEAVPAAVEPLSIHEEQFRRLLEREMKSPPEGVSQKAWTSWLASEFEDHPERTSRRHTSLQTIERMIVAARWGMQPLLKEHVRRYPNTVQRWWNRGRA